MKKKKSIFFLGFMLAMIQSPSAQITEFNINSIRNSIVRAVNDDTQLIYTEISPIESYFLLYQDGAPIARAFRLPSTPLLQVFDFRIIDENVYFCGTVKLGAVSLTEGLVGMFNIPSVFYGSGSVNYGVLGATSGNEMTVRSLRRMDLFKDSGNDCLAMVGDADFDSMSTHPVVSAYFNGTGWNFWTDIQKDYPRFTDIACLDNLIVAAGTLLEDSLCFVKTFRHTYDFPAQECNPYNIHYFTFGAAKGNVLITKETANTAMLAYFDVSSGTGTVLQRTPFDILTGSPLPSCSAHVTTLAFPSPYGSGQKMLELSVVGADIYLLQRAQYSAFGILDWRLGTQFPSPVFDAWYSLNGRQYSMDVTYANKTSGEASPSAKLQLHGPAWPFMNGHCQNFDKINATNVPVGFKEMGFQISPVSGGSFNYAIAATVFYIDANIICQE